MQKEAAKKEEHSLADVVSSVIISESVFPDEVGN